MTFLRNKDLPSVESPPHHLAPASKAWLHCSYDRPLHFPDLPKHPSHGFPDVSRQLSSFNRRNIYHNYFKDSFVISLLKRSHLHN